MSSPFPFLDADAVSATLDWSGAVKALEHALSDGLDPAAAAERSIFDVSHGQLLIMPAESPRGVGVKVASVSPGNPARGLPRVQALYLLLDRETHEPRALVDGTALTTLRTPAVSGVAVAHLATPEARHLVVFGTGPQAWGHVQVMRSVRALESVTVIGRSRGRAEQFAARVTADGLPASVGETDAVAQADIVVCATSASAPLFDGGLLGPETCVVAVGSHEPHMREVDAELVRRAAHGGGIVVETQAVALREAGDVILALREGACTESELVCIGDVVRRTERIPGVSLFKSCGMGWQDLVVAQALLDRWSIDRD